MDGYHNLIKFGFEIYARIDRYSCYVLWSYVRVSTQIEISIYCQYLDIIYNIRYMLFVIQSNCSSETPIIAEVHFQLCLRKTDEQKEITEE